MKSDYIPPTEEEIEKIKSGDWEVCKAFFLRNFEFICSAARKCVCRLSRISKYCYNRSDVDGLVNQCFINLPKMDLQKTEFFIVSLRHQLLYMLAGGTAHDWYIHCKYESRVSLDSPLRVSSRSGEVEDGSTLGDMLIAPSVEDFIDNLEEFRDWEPERIEILLSIVKEYVTAPQYLVLVYRLTTDLTFFSIANELNLSLSAVMSLWAGAKEKLYLRANDILNKLAKSGFKKSRCYLNFGLLPKFRTVSIRFAMQGVNLWQC